MCQRGVHHVAVVDPRERVIAVLDDRTVNANWPAGGPDAPHHRRVGDVVETGARCVVPEAPAAVMARAMVDAHTDPVPVVTAAGELIGGWSPRPIRWRRWPASR